MKYTFFSILILSLNACVHIEKSDVLARSGAPDSARTISKPIPYDAEKPRYALVVDEVRFANFGPSKQIVSTSIHQQQTTGSSKSTSRDDRGSTSQENAELRGSSTQLNKPNDALPLQAPHPQQQTRRSVADVIPVSADAPEKSEDQDRTSGTLISAQGSLRTNHTSTASTLHHSGTRRTGIDRGRSRTFLTSSSVSYETARDQRQIASMLRSALSDIGNFSLLEPGALRLPQFRLSADERGPFLVRAMITEYESRVEEGKSRVNLFTLYGSKEKVQVGVVALDVSIVELRTGRILSSFPVHAQFRSAEQKMHAGLILPVAEQEEFAQSVLDQALRTALTDAAVRAWEVLSTLGNG